jgi:toxin YoeB
VREVHFSGKAYTDFHEWFVKDRKVFKKLIDIIEEITKTPFEGTGKPEPLKHNLKGFWSRRITDSDRLVYEVTKTGIYIVSCEGHYSDK